MLLIAPMVTGPCPVPLPAQHHAPAALRLGAILPKLKLCFPAHTTAVPPLRQDGKQREAATPAPEDEVATRRLRQRQGFEHLLRHARPEDAAAWARYARWEETHGDHPCARAVWERAVAAAGHANPNVWVGYAEFEVRCRCADGARAVWERAVAKIPQADRLWRRCAQMEEGFGNYASARQVFDRWIEQRPALQAWLAYAEFELRNGEVRRARAVYERLVRRRPGDAEAWVRFAEFEARHGGVERTRACYRRGVEAVVEEEGEEGVAAGELVAAFAEFEERCGKTEWARAIYLYALELLREGPAEELVRREYEAFERRCGPAKR